METTAEDVARWMFEEMWLIKKGVLVQADAWEAIRYKFGGKFAEENEHGHHVISAQVLAAFEDMISADDVVWSRSGRLWRWRQPGDKPGRMQD